MVVQKTEQTVEEKNAETKAIADRKRDATNAILSSLELPVEEETKPKAEELSDEELLETADEDLTEKGVARKRELEEDPSKVKTERDSDISDEELLELPDGDLSAEGIARKRELEADPSKIEKTVKKEEELIPKSKVDKMLKKMERRIDSATRKAKTASASEAKDPDMARLENMSPEKLKETKRKCRKAMIKAQTDGDEDRLEALLDLEDKCDQVTQGAPVKFRNKQLALFQEKADEIEEDPDIEDFDRAAPIILQLAKEAYAKYPKLQKLEEGQAMALESAVDRYKLMQKTLSGKKETRYLKQKVSKFKRKTNLDTQTMKGKLKISQRLKTLRQKAFRGGDLTDKVNLIKEDPRFGIDQLLPEEGE